MIMAGLLAVRGRHVNEQHLAPDSTVLAPEPRRGLRLLDRGYGGAV